MAEGFSWEKIKYGLKTDLWDYQMLEPQLAEYYREQKDQLADFARQCNQMQLSLYSNKFDYIFYQTATLKQVDKLDEELLLRSEPNNAIMEGVTSEKERLQRLLFSLLRQAEDERMHAELSDSVIQLMDDSLLHSVAIQDQPIEQALDRDSCIMMVHRLIDSYDQLYEWETTLCAQYAELHHEFASTYEYMLKRQREIRHQVFRKPGSTYFEVLLRLPLFIEIARDDSRQGKNDWRKMVTSGELATIFGQMFGMLLLAILMGIALHYAHRRFQWQTRFLLNPRIYTNLLWVVLCLLCLSVDVWGLHLTALSAAANIFMVYLAFVIILQVSLLIRDSGLPASAAMHLYAPALFFGFCTIFMRLFMLPDSALTLIVFPLALATFVWHLIAFRRHWGDAPRFDSAMAGLTIFVLFAMTILAAIGHVFLAMVVFLWWQAQEAAFLISIALYDRLRYYAKHRLVERKRIYHEKAHSKEIVRQQDSLIQVTWFFDLLQMVGVPFLAIASLPFCMYVALDYFNAGESYSTFFYRVFYSLVSDGDTLLQLSCYNFCRIAILFFIFRYIAYVLTSAYKQIVIVIELRRSGRDHIEDNQVNQTMGVNIIQFVVWALYLCVCCIIFAIPTSALTFIFAGLATGIGFAMRDIINNVFYGMQLMAGRLHVGDYIICGNYRGSVTSISYQTTQMKTEENAVVYFANSDLFAKNFMNLTRENPYEVNRVYCNIAYGSDVELAERLIREAIEPFNEVDKYGRTRLSAKEGIRVEMTNLADSCIQLAIRFGVIAEQRTWFLPVLRKAIYQKLHDGGIRIPYPQVDLHVQAPVQQGANPKSEADPSTNSETNQK